MSPSDGGGSTRITSAPQSAKVRTQDGPARASVRSITLKRDSGRVCVCAGQPAGPDLSTGLCIVIPLKRFLARFSRSLIAGRLRPREFRLALVHEGAAALAEILRVHAVGAELL